MQRIFTSSTPLAGLLLLCVACSPDSPEDAGTDPPGQEAELAHAQCIRDHGIDWPDPEYVDGEWRMGDLGEDADLESPAYREAEAECARVRREAQPEGDVPDPADRAQVEEDLERMLEFAACMRDEGIDFPDPQIDDSGAISGPAGPADGDWEAFEAAQETCEVQTGQPMP